MSPSISTAYKALSQTSSKAEIDKVLQDIVNAVPFTFDSASRSGLIAQIIQDLKDKGKSGSRLNNATTSLAFLALKTLGKMPTGSEGLAEPGSLETLLVLAKDEVDLEASNEALRCVANALLLHESARTSILSSQVNGGHICIGMLEKSSANSQIFILSRILFLCTVSRSQFIVSVVESKSPVIVDTISSKLEITLHGIQTGQTMAKEAMTDLLKFTFNLLATYPKMVDCEPQGTSSSSAANSDNRVLGDYWSSNLSGLLPILIRLFHSLPPSFPSPLLPPLTHVIHALITIPMNDALKTVWIPPSLATAEKRRNSSGHPSPTIPPAVSRSSSAASSDTSRSNSPVTTAPKKQKTIDKALAVISRSMSRSTSPNPSRRNYDTFQHVKDLLEISFAHYFPGSIDPDDPSIRENLKKELSAASGFADTTIDDLLSPLMLLLTKFVQHDVSSRKRTRQWLVPPDMERETPLEGRPDMLGRCIRLLGSVYFSRLKDSVGELLFAMCDSDAGLLSAMLGYGNVAGFLFNKGIMSAPPPPAAGSGFIEEGYDEITFTETKEGAPINPITGTATKPKAKDDEPELTEEEKEREMEKLFVLFDRLEKSGAVPKEQNPVRKAIEKSMQH